MTVKCPECGNFGHTAESCPTADAPWRDEETLRELYWDEGLSTVEIAKELDVGSGSTISRQLEKHGIDTRGDAVRQQEPKRNKIEGVNIIENDPNRPGLKWRDDEWLFERYWVDGMSPQQIIDEHDDISVSSTTMRREIRDANFPTRTNRDARFLHNGQTVNDHGTGGKRKTPLSKMQKKYLSGTQWEDHPEIDLEQEDEFTWEQPSTGEAD